MISRILMGRMTILSSKMYTQSFQLCSKRIPHYCFGQTNKNPSPHPENDHSEPKQQQKSKARTSRQRLMELKQQKRQQDYKKKLQQINITSGSFNAFSQYFLLEKQKWFYILIGALTIFLLIEEDSPLCYKTMGVFKDPFTGIKKFTVINQYRQKNLQKILIQIIKKQLDFWTQEKIKGDNSLVNKALQKKLQIALENLKQRYGIEFKTLPEQQTNYQIAESNQTIVASVLGQDKLIVSTKLLRLRPQTIQSLILLMHSLHSRLLHVQKISFWQRLNLTPSNDTRKIIKLEKTFISNAYTAQSIGQTIQLIANKYSDDQNSHKTLKDNIEKALRQLFAVKSSSKSMPQFDLRSRLNQANQFIL